MLFITWYPSFSLNVRARYLIPLYPLLIFFIFCGLVEVQKQIQRIWHIETRNIVVIGISILIIITSVAHAIPIITKYNILNHSKITDGPNTPEAQEAFTYISKYVPEDEIIAFRWPGYIPMYTKRKSIGTPGWDGNIIFNQSKDNNIQFVLLKKDKENFKLFNERLKKEPIFKPIFENSEFILVKRI